MTRCGLTLENAFRAEQINHCSVLRGYQFFWDLNKKGVDSQGWLTGLFCENGNYRKDDNNPT